MSREMTADELNESLRQSENSRLALLRENAGLRRRVGEMENVLLKTKHDCRDAVEVDRGLSIRESQHVIERHTKAARPEDVT